MKKYIHTVCDDCGLEANKLTCLKKYGALPKKAKSTLSTYHKGTCDCCGKEASVTEARDFFYPDLSLLNKPRIKAKLLKLVSADLRESKDLAGTGLEGTVFADSNAKDGFID